MPAYKTPKQFPGTQHLPEMVQLLLQRTFPPDQVPMPGVVIPQPGRPVPAGINLSSLFRTMQTKIPDAPQTQQKIQGAFDTYRNTLSNLLLRRKPPQ